MSSESTGGGGGELHVHNFKTQGSFLNTLIQKESMKVTCYLNVRIVKRENDIWLTFSSKKR